jgi:lysozyme family protein
MSSINKGDKGVGVMLLQGILHKLGYDISDVDGNFGSETTAAVKAFQSDMDLEDDGVVGKNTANAIINELWSSGDDAEEEDGDWEDSDEDWETSSNDEDEEDDEWSDEGGDDYESV